MRHPACRYNVRRSFYRIVVRPGSQETTLIFGCASRSEVCPESLPMRTRITIIVLALIGLASTVIVPVLMPPRVVSARNACVANLEYIARAKEAWAQRTKASRDAVPTFGDLFGPNENGWVECPAGGKYDPGAVNRPPTCSIGPPVHIIQLP